MYACSHKYLMGKHWETLKSDAYHEIINPDVANISVAFGPDLDFIFNKWPSLREVYKSHDETLHRDTSEIIDASLENPLLHDMKAMGIHIKQDEIIHSFIDNYIETFRSDVSDILKRDATEDDIHNTVEMYLEYKIIEKDRKLPRELRHSLIRTQSLRKALADIFAKVYSDYGVNSKNFRNALIFSYAIGIARLRKKKYSKYFSKQNGKRKKHFSSLDLFVNFLIENCGFHYLLDAYPLNEYIVEETYDESRPIPAAINGRSRRTLDNFLNMLEKDPSIYLQS